MILLLLFLSVHLFSHLTNHYKVPTLGLQNGDTDTVFRGAYGLGESNENGYY